MTMENPYDIIRLALKMEPCHPWSGGTSLILQTGHTLNLPSYMATGRSPLETCQDSWQPSPGLHATHRTLSAAHAILFQQQPSRQAAEIIKKIGSKVRMKIFVFKSEKN